MRWRVALLAMLLAGCFIKPDPHGATDDAAGSGDGGNTHVPSCPNTPFGSQRIIVPQPSSGPMLDPYERFDQRELFYSQFGTPDGYHTYVTTRSSPQDAYPAAPAGLPAFDVAGSQEYDATLSGDGLAMALISSRTGGPHLFTATRPSLGEPFAMPQLELNLATTMLDGESMTPDGLRVYYSFSIAGSGDSILYRSQRPMVTLPFELDTTPLGAGINYPTLTPDELEVFYNAPGGTALHHQVRTSAQVAFDGLTSPILVMDGSDPTVSADGQRLIFSSGGALWEMTRVCN